MPVYARRRRAAEAVRRVYGFAQVDTTVDSCCCSLHIKPLFLPNEIISTLSVRPDSSCRDTLYDTNYVVTGSETRDPHY